MGWLALALVLAFVLYIIIDRESLLVSVLAMGALLPVLFFQLFSFDKSTSIALAAILWLAIGALFNSKKA